MKLRQFYSLTFLFSLLFVFNSCEDPVTPYQAQEGEVVIDFKYKVGDKEVVFNDYIYKSPLGHDYMITNNKYYLSRINIVDSKQNKFELALAHLVDIHEEPSLRLETGAIPPGEYQSLEFIFGLNVADNDQSVLPNTVENQNMFWPAQLTGADLPAGYHFMKYEGKYKPLDGGEPENFNIHLGPTHGNNNFFDVVLPFDSPFSIDGNKVEIDLICNLLEWLQNPNIYDYKKYGQSIMPKQDAQIELKANGATVFSIGAIR